jgi:hypothetical protein
MSVTARSRLISSLRLTLSIAKATVTQGSVQQLQANVHMLSDYLDYLGREIFFPGFIKVDAQCWGELFIASKDLTLPKASPEKYVDLFISATEKLEAALHIQRLSEYADRLDALLKLFTAFLKARGMAMSLDSHTFNVVAFNARTNPNIQAFTQANEIIVMLREKHPTFWISKLIQQHGSKVEDVQRSIDWFDAINDEIKNSRKTIKTSQTEFKKQLQAASKQMGAFSRH